MSVQGGEDLCEYIMAQGLLSRIKEKQPPLLWVLCGSGRTNPKGIGGPKNQLRMWFAHHRWVSTTRQCVQQGHQPSLFLYWSKLTIPQWPVDCDDTEQENHTSMMAARIKSPEGGERRPRRIFRNQGCRNGSIFGDRSPKGSNFDGSSSYQ